MRANVAEGIALLGPFEGAGRDFERFFEIGSAVERVADAVLDVVANAEVIGIVAFMHVHSDDAVFLFRERDDLVGFGDVGMTAIFFPGKWKIRGNPHAFGPNRAHVTNDVVRARAASIYHEARHAEQFYNFEGLRRYKDKFLPVWRPRYLAFTGGLALPKVLLDVSTLISGGMRELVSK